MKVLMCNRENALSNPGGDTTVMLRISEELRAIGIDVDIDLIFEKDMRHYDIIHLHNFATPDHTRYVAEKCVKSGTPYVVTTMCEDWPLFYNQMHEQMLAMYHYVNDGQPAERFKHYLQKVRNCKPAEKLDNTWTADHASCLIASGEREKETLERDYPETKNISTYRLGSNLSSDTGDESRLNKLLKTSDFVFCVGRLETRKNQLTLLKALEDHDIPVVFATGGFTYQPLYSSACTAFKRRGKTYFLNSRIDDDLLASAYTAARVHVLPSWYELPGIVSLEAAKRGTNIVVTDNGTARDYFGNSAFYCEPGDPESICNATLEAMSTPFRHGLVDAISDCTWPNAAKQILDIYQRIV
ncbi:MAG TPA: glycosyltransferase [Gammaproteobacteria bacterium]|nr:glycosyltransferase [Gammaproteobacteria bacterium]